MRLRSCQNGQRRQATDHQLPRITDPLRLIFSCRAYIHSLSYHLVSTLWTPSGEHPLRNHTPRPPEQDHATTAAGGEPEPAGGFADAPEMQPTQDQEIAMEEIRQAIASAPAEEVIANHCYGLFELAAIHLSKQPPDAKAAQLAIDAMGAILDGVGHRLDQQAATLEEALAQIRLAYVTITAAGSQPSSGGTQADGTAAEGPADREQPG